MILGIGEHGALAAFWSESRALAWQADWPSRELRDVGANEEVEDLWRSSVNPSATPAERASSRARCAALARSSGALLEPSLDEDDGADFLTIGGAGMTYFTEPND